MAEVKAAFVSADQVARTIEWGMRHPKFVTGDFTGDIGHPMRWAQEHVFINKSGYLLFSVGDKVEGADSLDGAIALESCATFRGNIMNLFVQRPEGQGPLLTEYSLFDVGVRRAYLLKQAERQSSLNDPHQRVDPDPRAFLGYLGALQHVGDFCWQEAEESAAQHRLLQKSNRDTST